MTCCPGGSPPEAATEQAGQVRRLATVDTRYMSRLSVYPVARHLIWAAFSSLLMTCMFALPVVATGPDDVHDRRRRQRRVGRNGGGPADARSAVYRVLVIGCGSRIPVAPDVEPMENGLIHRVADQMWAPGDLVGITGERGAALVVDIGHQIDLIRLDLVLGWRPGKPDGDVVVPALVLVQHLGNRVAAPVRPAGAALIRPQFLCGLPLAYGLAHLGQHLRHRGRAAVVAVGLCPRGLLPTLR